MSKKPEIKFKFKINWGMLAQTDEVFVYAETLFKAINKVNEFYFRATILECWNAQFNPPALIPEIKNIHCHGNMPIFEQIIRRSKEVQRRKKK